LHLQQKVYGFVRGFILLAILYADMKFYYFRIAKRGKNMNTYVLCFQDIDRSKFMVAGGKGANLGELSRIKGIRVPEGFCVTTEAYKKITENNRELNNLLDELMRLKAEERENIGSAIGDCKAGGGKGSAHAG